MRLPQLSHGYQKTIIIHTGRHTYPVPLREARQSKVDALVSNPSGRRTIIRNQITTGSLVSQGQSIAAQPLARPVTKPKRTSKERIKSSTVALYVSVFALLVSSVAIGYKAPQEEVQAISSENVLANTATAVSRPSTDEVVAAHIAASVASAADLAVAGNVAELAVATKVQSQYISSDDGSSIAKPVIVELSAATRNISTYTTVEGDTVASVAARFGITTNTLKWANDLTEDTLEAGDILDILPVNGIVYTVKDGDTAEKLAEKYKANASLIITYNDLDVSGLSTGLKIVIPDGELPNNERPGYVSPSSAGFITGYSSGAGDGRVWRIRTGTPNLGNYAWGNCTAYAFDRRLELGRPIGANWGNAGSWAFNARNAGYVVNRTPAAGAVIQDWGHVAIVEEVLPNGDLRLSEMNYYAFGASGANNVVSGRILPAAYVGQYYYIH